MLPRFTLIISHSSRLRVRKQNGEQNARTQIDRRGAGREQNAGQNAPAGLAMAENASKTPAPYRMQKKIFSKTFV